MQTEKSGGASPDTVGSDPLDVGRPLFEHAVAQSDLAIKAIQLRLDAGKQAVLLALGLLTVQVLWVDDRSMLLRGASFAMLVSAVAGLLHIWWVARLASEHVGTPIGLWCEKSASTANRRSDGCGATQMIALFAGVVFLGLHATFG